MFIHQFEFTSQCEHHSPVRVHYSVWTAFTRSCSLVTVNIIYQFVFTSQCEHWFPRPRSQNTPTRQCPQFSRIHLPSPLMWGSPLSPFHFRSKRHLMRPPDADELSYGALSCFCGSWHNHRLYIRSLFGRYAPIGGASTELSDRIGVHSKNKYIHDSEKSSSVPLTKPLYWTESHTIPAAWSRFGALCASSRS